MAAARIQRWSLLLGAHQYDIVYRSGDKHSNADGLSRLPLENKVEEDNTIELLHMSQMENLPTTPVEVAKETRRDKILSRFYLKISMGLEDKEDEELRPYFQRKDELTLQRGCILWGIRVVIPQTLQAKVLEELHGCHTGIVRMKAIARSYVWWPSLDKDLEQLSGSCTECLAYRKLPALAPLHPWTFPEKPWIRVHVDYAGPFQGTYFLVLIDAFSKWPEVVMMQSTTAEKTIEGLRTIFARFGLPEQLCSDNGPQFTADTFAGFLKINNIKHVRSSPYHPSTNGLVERFIQTLKVALSKDTTKAPLLQRLCQFLFQYRTTPHATTQRSPAELLLQMKPRTRLDILRPSVERDVHLAQTRQTGQRDKRAKERSLEVGDKVIYREFRTGARPWSSGVVKIRKGPVSFVVENETGGLVRRHQDHIQRTSPVPNVSKGVQGTGVQSNEARQVAPPAWMERPKRLSRAPSRLTY